MPVDKCDECGHTSDPRSSLSHYSSCSRWSADPQLPPQAVDEHPTLAQSRAEKLAQWWRDTAEAEIVQTVDKSVEYSSADLIEIGRQLHQAGVPIPPGMTNSWVNGVPAEDTWFAELGCYFYLVGKLARWTGAVQEGRRVSDDTVLDIGIYTRMVQRIRQAGGWPGV